MWSNREVRDKLNQIADWMEKDTEYTWVNRNPIRANKEYCTLTVIEKFMRLGDIYIISLVLYYRLKTNVQYWNDVKGRTKEDVIKLYRICAKEIKV